MKDRFPDLGAPTATEQANFHRCEPYIAASIETIRDVKPQFQNVSPRDLVTLVATLLCVLYREELIAFREPKERA
jgi:hypothetical protein